MDLDGPEHRGVAITALFFGGPLSLRRNGSQDAETSYRRPTGEGVEPGVEFGMRGANLSPWWLSPRVGGHTAAVTDDGTSISSQLPRPNDCPCVEC